MKVSEGEITLSYVVAWKAFAGTAVNDRLHIFLPKVYICVASKKVIL